jgi:hypothetical protein
VIVFRIARQHRRSQRRLARANGRGAAGVRVTGKRGGGNKPPVVPESVRRV